MQLGMIGLGRMGGNMVLRLLRKGFGDHKEVPIEQMRAALVASIDSWKKAFGK
jgi:6-phosphogluconate dehydrogenase (decarboxylating)